MNSERERIEAAIATLTAQRGVLGDAVVELALGPLRDQLAAMTPSEQTLRQVTILFLDVVGSTALSQHLDPEDIHALMDGALARCTEVVRAHGGKVLQYAGDNLLAAFGIGQAQEDDAERAVRAGLALADEGRRLGAAVLAGHGHAGFDVRIGIHTGSVLLGGGVDGDASIRGIAVNVAARLEQTAPPGTVCISRDTCRQVRQHFQVEERPPQVVKGIDGPIASYRVVGALEADPEPAVGAAAVDTSMVGRDAEMAHLLGLVEEARATPAMRFVTVVAEAGVGKSRLYAELNRRLGGGAGGVRRFNGRARPHGTNLPYGVVRDVVARHAAILDSDPSDTARGKLVASFGAAFGPRAEEQAALIGQLIGLDFSADPHIAGIVQDGRQIRDRAIHALASFLRLAASDGSVVALLLDDLHWADTGSLDLVEQLAHACRDLPLLIACFTRPALLERRATWAEAVPQATRLMLRPLSTQCSGLLADALLSRLAEPEPELHALLVRNAEGNPFHMEELLAVLVDDGVVSVAPEGWRVDRARLAAVRVPPTLTAVLQSRLDALPASDRTVLQRSSVVGHVFWDRALDELAAGSSSSLAALAARSLISERAVSALAAAREFAFGHHLLHQVTYQTVLKATRRDLHRRVADWLVLATGDRIGEHFGLIGEHYERGGDATNAALYLQRAAAAAYAAAAPADAMTWIARAMAVLPNDDLRARFELLLLRSNVHNSVGRRREQGEDVEAAERCAEALDDDRFRARAGAVRVMLVAITGSPSEVVAMAQRVKSLALAVGDEASWCQVVLDEAHAIATQGDEAAAIARIEAALEKIEAKPLSDPGAFRRVVAHSRLQWIKAGLGDFVAARAHVEIAMETARLLRNRRFEGGLANNLGLLEFRLGHVDRAEALVREGLAISREVGDRGSVPYALVNLADIALSRGDASAGLALAIESRETAIEAGNKVCAGVASLSEGTCHLALGHHDEAAACYDRGDAWLDAATTAEGGRDSAVWRATLALSTGRLDEAVRLAEGVIAWLDERGGADRLEDAHRCFVSHRVLAAAGSPRAAGLLERARAVVLGHAQKLASPDDREAYLSMARHREIEAAWAAAQAS